MPTCGDICSFYICDPVHANGQRLSVWSSQEGTQPIVLSLCLEVQGRMPETHTPFNMASISLALFVLSILPASIIASLADIHNLNEIETKQRLNDLFQATAEIQNGPAFRPVLKDFHSIVYDPNLHAELLRTFEDAAEEEDLSSGKCIADFSKLLFDMLGEKAYTFQVLDSIGKPPSALLQGAFLWVGSYDQCTNITVYKSGTSKEVQFQGKHCLSMLQGPSLEKISPFLGEMGLLVGLCVPSSCSQANLPNITNLGLTAVSKLLNMTGPSNLTLQGVGGICAEPAPLITGDIVAIVLCALILFLITSGSTYDIVQRVLTNWKKSSSKKTLFPSEHNLPSGDKVDLVDHEVNVHSNVQLGSEDARVVSPKPSLVKGFFQQFLMSFSAITNAEKLLGASVREGQLGAINGIRVISMWWVILGHTYVFLVGNKGAGLFSNPLSLLGVIKRFSFQAVVNATYSVDSFFFLSGLLVAYLLLKELKKSDGKINWALLYFHRFWRLTPVYMFVLMIYATIALHIPTGPFMRTADGGQKQCQKYWWTNLLYINNLHPRELAKECMGWSWYLANDMQFFIITPPIIYLLYRFRYVAYSMISALIMTNLIVTGVIARTHRNDGDIYVRPWHRISPYVVGIATGYILYLWENNGRPKMNKVVALTGWCIAIAINMSVLYGRFEPISTGKQWNDDVTALYTATSRFAWSLGLAWLTFACITGYGGPINIFLSWRVWAPLGRLTYCAYLVHPIVMISYNTSLRQLIYQNDYTMIYIYIAHIVMSYMVAFVISITVEAPMLGLEKLIFKRKKD